MTRGATTASAHDPSGWQTRPHGWACARVESAARNASEVSVGRRTCLVATLTFPATDRAANAPIPTAARAVTQRERRPA